MDIRFIQLFILFIFKFLLLSTLLFSFLSQLLALITFTAIAFYFLLDIRF